MPPAVALFPASSNCSSFCCNGLFPCVPGDHRHHGFAPGPSALAAVELRGLAKSPALRSNWSPGPNDLPRAPRVRMATRGLSLMHPASVHLFNPSRSRHLTFYPFPHYLSMNLKGTFIPSNCNLPSISHALPLFSNGLYSFLAC